MTSSKPPVKCNICDSCICYCNNTLDNMFQTINRKVLEERILEIKKREEYLRYLRKELEKTLRSEYLSKQLEDTK